MVAEAEGVEDVLPIAPREEECLAVVHLPLEELGLHAPPGIEMDVLDAADVVDGVDPDAAAERLALDVADQMALVARGVDAVVGIE